MKIILSMLPYNNCVLKKIFYISIFAVVIITVIGFSSRDAYAASYTAVASGDWNDPATWGGTLPRSPDSLVIPSGITVTIPAGLAVNADGTIQIDSGGIVINNGVIQIHSVGTIINSGTIISTDLSTIQINFGGV